MIGRLNHIALVVPDLEKAAETYREILGAEVGEAEELPEHGVKLVFINLPNTKIELLHPLDEDSPIAAFLERNPAGGMHHVCYEVNDIDESARKLREGGMRILGDVKIGAHGKKTLFLHPKDSFGTLIELEQA